jgi:hypothetical protein
MQPRAGSSRNGNLPGMLGRGGLREIAHGGFDALRTHGLVRSAQRGAARANRAGRTFAVRGLASIALLSSDEM